MSQTLSAALNDVFYQKGTTPSPSASQRVPLLDAKGNPIGSNSLAGLSKTILTQAPTIDADYFNRADIKAAFDNLFVAVTRKSDNFPLYIKPCDWAGGYSNTSNYHTAGIAIVNGGSHGFVLAKDEFDGTKQWGPQGTRVANSDLWDRMTAMRDITGQSRTAAIASNSVYSSTDYAAAWCHAYVQTGESTTGTGADRRGAGKWWLPSAGELWMIYQNFWKINQLLSLIESKQSGTTKQLQQTWYWSSTEGSANGAWFLGFSDGDFRNGNKTGTGRVRPVSAL